MSLSFIPTVWAARLLTALEKTLVYGQAQVANRDYEGDIREAGNTVKIASVGDISIGDYVLAGGEVAAMVLLEAVVRLLPGVLGAAESHADESFENGLLEYPQYTRPQVFEGREIPAVLTSGDHGRVEKWRRAESEALTRARRPDLLKGQ